MSSRTPHSPIRPRLGAWCAADGVHFRVWAPERKRVDVAVERRGTYPLEKSADGTFAGVVAEIGAGDRYRYRLDGGESYPDPASRFQPEGVHGGSEIVDPSRFAWSDSAWEGLRLEDLVVYELHVGTFTPSGTFATAIDRLPYLLDLGVTAIELMPVADFPGRRNWGYDGVDLFAPARCYGHPDDLRRLIDTAHGIGLGVLLDVVYNHLGPDGAYLAAFSPYYFTKRHHTPWGAAVNLDGRHSRMVRDFFIENALHWVREYHIDGLRLDATHALIDDSPEHFLAELAEQMRGSGVGGWGLATTKKRPLLIAEDHRNLARMVRPEADGGWGLDAVWADDFHHQVRRALAGDLEGYYRDYSGSTRDLATTVRRGWFYCGQYSEHLGHDRGSDPTNLSPRQLVICLQNHDQIGNRAFGERLSHQIALAAYRAAAVLLLCAPETPLLFMGQEWAASSPFLYFTDHKPEVGRLVTKGRRREFASFSAFADPEARRRIPDPQAEETFQRSRLDWAETQREPHASTRRLYQALLALRRSEPALRSSDRNAVEVEAAGDDALLLYRGNLAIAVQLRNAGTVHLRGTDWQLLLSTEDPAYSPDPSPVRMEQSNGNTLLHFPRPGASIAKRSAS